MRRLRKCSVALAAAALVLTGCGSANTAGTGTDSPSAGSSDSASPSASTSESPSDAGAQSCDGLTGDGPKVGIAYDVGGRGDNSFNDAAWRGMQQAATELQATCIEAKATAGENDAQRADRLRTLAEAGFNPVIAVGFIYSPAASEVAKDYPDTDFAVIDGYSQFVKPAKNLVDLTFAEEQGSYLVGVAAALTSKRHHIGFLGGTHGDLIKKFEAGYTAGAKAVDPKVQVDVVYLTEDPNDGATGFENPAGGKTAAEGLYKDGKAAGADVVYHAAGKSGGGLFEAVSTLGDGFWAIGVDSDQYLTATSAEQPHILTSMLKRVDTAVFDVVDAVGSDSFVDGNKTYDLAADGVGYSTSGGFVDSIKAQIDAYAAKIKSGKIKVPTAP